MSEANRADKGQRRRSVGWWVRLVLVLVPLALGALCLYYWIWEDAPKWVYWRLGLWVMIALEAAYDVIVAACLVAVPVLAMQIVRARRRGIRRPAAARGLLLALSTLLAIGMAEAAAAAWQARAHRGTAVPVGGLRQPRPARRPVVRVNPSEIELPTTFPEATADGTLNIAVVGESSAGGVPYNFWLSIPAIVQWQLEQAIPGRRFQLEFLADSGETLETQHQKLRRLRRRPDAMIIYCGHNEFSSRLPPGRELDYYRDAPPTPLWQVLAEQVERASPLCGLIRETADKCRIAVPPAPGAHRALVDSPAFTPLETEALITDFRRRLETIVAYAEQLGAIPILIIPAGNDSGFEPNRSYLPATTPYAERQAFAREFLAARRLEDPDPAESQKRYRSLMARYPGFAEIHYRLARVLERAGAWEDAYRQDMTARDLDGMPARCPVAFQEAYREVAARHACILIDSQAYFHAIGRHGLLDDGLFHDAMHPSLRGQIALAQGVLAGLKAWGAFGWPEATPAPVIDPARCAAHFGLGPYPWQRICLGGMMVYDFLIPQHYDPRARRAKHLGFRRGYLDILAGKPAESVGLPNIGVPPAVPIVPEAAVLTGAAAHRGRSGSLSHSAP